MRSKSLALAEGVGFEPTVSFPTPVFKTGTFGRSVIPPRSDVIESRRQPWNEVAQRRQCEAGGWAFTKSSSRLNLRPVANSTNRSSHLKSPCGNILWKFCAPRDKALQRPIELTHSESKSSFRKASEVGQSREEFNHSWNEEFERG